MKPFEFVEPRSQAEALQSFDERGSMWLAGGTTLVDLMKLNVLTPNKVISIKPLLDRTIQRKEDQLLIGAGSTMAEVADHALIRKHFPLVRHSLILAASPQIRNMATIGGNLLQRTRSPYFRHIDFATINADVLPEGLDRAQAEGVDTSSMAILAHGGKLCGTYPGDFAIAFVALNGTLHLQGPDGDRSLAAREFYTAPSDKSLQYRTQLKPGEIITAVSLPITAAAEHSYYFKVRERSSYAFALASAAVALELDGQGDQAKIVDVHVGLGGLATIPWASPAAEQVLRGQKATDAIFSEAAEAALKDAEPPAGLEWKVTLAKRVLVRTLKQLRVEAPPTDEQLFSAQHGR